ncbi:MAG TPA: hypothetical protein VGM88_18285 [Kofleriaceae bacterium]|jgi:hypothetical protein
MRALAVAILLASGTAAADVELLHAIPTEIAVSTTVANPKIIPAHIADGKLETAWNSRTGAFDSVVRVRIPAGAHVRAIKLTAGFAHVEGKDDYFTMNPRIQSVRVAGPGGLVKIATLDENSRAMQEIAIDGPGGDYELSFPKILPGGKPTWRELCISELEVWGELPVGIVASPSSPLVHVGTLSPPPPPPKVARAMLVYQTRAGMPLLVTLGDAPDSMVPHGAPVLVDPVDAYRKAVVVQPIAPPSSLPPGTIGRVVRVEGDTAAVCDAVITDVGVIVDGKISTTAPAASGATPAQLAAEAWAHQDARDRELVGILVSTSSCAGGLFAHDPKLAPKRGKLSHDKKLVKALKDKFLEIDYPRMYENYELNDLNGEYGDAAANEAKLPPDERMSPDKVEFTIAIACDGASCIGVVGGTFGSHHKEHAWPIAKGVLGEPFYPCGVGAPVAAADVDGDGSVDILYQDSGELGYTGATTGVARFRQEPCR